MGKVILPVLVITCIKYPVRVIDLADQARICGDCIFKHHCKIKVVALLLVAKVSADLREIVIAIGVLTGCFDVDDVEVFSSLRRPLREKPRPLNTGDNGLEEF